MTCRVSALPRPSGGCAAPSTSSCNCDFGCGCNFGGFPNSDDGSCRAMVGLHIKEGACGDVSLNGIKAASIIHWPKAIHEGNGTIEGDGVKSRFRAGELRRRARRHVQGAAAASPT